MLDLTVVRMRKECEKVPEGISLTKGPKPEDTVYLRIYYGKYDTHRIRIRINPNGNEAPVIEYNEQCLEIGEC